MALTMRLLSWYTSNGAGCSFAAASMAFHNCSKKSRSHCNSSADFPIPAVRAIKACSLGKSRESIASRSEERSSPAIRREIPPPFGLSGINTK